MDESTIGSGNRAFLRGPRTMERGLLCRGRKVIFCFIRRLCLVGTAEDMLKKALETDISLHRGPIRKPGGELI